MSEFPRIKINYFSKTKKINIKDYIEKNSDNLKEEFLNFLNKLENIKINNTKIYEIFSSSNNHNLWEMSLIKEKSYLKSKNIYKVIIFLAIKKIINENKIKKIYFYNLPIENEIIEPLLKNKHFYYKFENSNNSNKSTKFFLKSFFLVRFFYYFFYLFKKLFFELFFNNFKDNHSNVLILSYFAHFNIKKKRKIRFNQFGNLPNILNEKFSIDNQYIFVPNKNNLTINSLPEDIKSTYSMLNSKLNVYSKILIILKYCFFSTKYTFIKHVYLKKYKNIDTILFNIMSDDYDSSFSGPVLIDNLIWIEVFENYLSETNKKKFGIFLFENQAWEKAMVTAWENHNHGEIFAYTPTSINYWHLYNFDNSKKNYSSPSKILISSNDGYKLLKEQYKYKNIKIHKVESLWYNYLLDIKPSNIRNKKYILIIGDYSSKRNYKIFNIINNSELRKNKNILFKPHPHDVKKYNLKNIRITKKNNEYFFKNSSLVISPGSTAAILEYLYFGNRVFVYDDPNDLDVSPIKHLNYQFKFKSVKEFNKLLKANFKKNKIINNFKNYYILDKGLKKWKKFL